MGTVVEDEVVMEDLNNSVHDENMVDLAKVAVESYISGILASKPVDKQVHVVLTFNILNKSMYDLMESYNFGSYTELFSSQDGEVRASISRVVKESVSTSQKYVDDKRANGDFVVEPNFSPLRYGFVDHKDFFKSLFNLVDSVLILMDGWEYGKFRDVVLDVVSETHVKVFDKDMNELSIDTMKKMIDDVPSIALNYSDLMKL